jgi:WD40 repeat protein
MNILNRFFKVFSVGFMLFFLVGNISAQVGSYFGQNKIHYKDFDWAVFQTEHFDVHYYPEEEQAAYDAARMAERGYAYLSQTLNHEVKEKIPLILYASLNDFSQTNTVYGMMDQGTRGVTESLKNRVIIPITGSYREFNHVLVHELVHAFQYDIMLKSDYANKRFNPPLWLVEGMAEYLSAGMDNTTRMWVRDGLLFDNLLTIKQLNNTYDVRVYRLGQSLWYYIAENYGNELVGTLFKTAVRLGDVEMAIKNVLNIEQKELTKKWHEYARRQVMPQDSTLFETLKDFATKITRQEGYYHRMNLIPSVSPDGKQIAYVANKSFNEDLFLSREDEKGMYRDEKLISGGESKRFETLRFFESSIGWSRDGKALAFVSKVGRDDALYIMDPNTKEIKHKILFNELNGLQSPTFSPSGDQVAFVGINGGISDLYIYNLNSNKLNQLTKDRFAVLHPQWSPDGKSIVFVTDRGAGTNEEELLFGDYDLALYFLNSGKVELITELEGNTSSPQWSPDSKEIAFISDHQGIPNIYQINLSTKSIIPITALRNGVSGITETTPALSWSANGEVMVFSTFENTSWQMYKFNPFEKRNRDWEPLKTEPIPPAIATTTEDLKISEISQGKGRGDTSPDSFVPELPDQNLLYGRYNLVPSDSISRDDYKSKFKLDAISFGGGYDTYYGATGDAVFLFTDMMGDHSLYFSSQLQFSSFLHSNFGLGYFSQGNRINYGLQAYQANEIYTLYGDYFTLGLLRNTYRGFSGIASYPFSKFSRIEVFGGLSWVDQDLVEETSFFDSFNRETVDLGLYNFYQTGASLVFDNTTYGPMGPARGSRSRFSVETTTKDLRFTNLMIDYRKYFSLGHRSTLAWRLMGANSIGRDEQIFSIGGSYYYRGADYYELFGSKFLLSNLEYRFPLMPFAPASYDFLSSAIFFDAAGAWGIDVPGYTSEKFHPFTNDGGFRLKDLKSALGISFRFNIGYFLLQYNIAWPTDLQNFGSPIKKFSIGTFF